MLSSPEQGTVAHRRGYAPGHDSLRERSCIKKSVRSAVCCVEERQGSMRVSNLIARTLAIVFLGGLIVVSAPQAPTVRAVDEKVLREYAGIYGLCC